MNQRLRLKIIKLGVIIFSWLVVAVIITCYDHFVLRSDISGGFSANYSFSRNLIMNLSAAFMGGLMGGSFLVFYVNERYRDKPYGFTVIAVLVSFVVIIGIIVLVLGLILMPIQSGKSISDPETKRLFYSFLADPVHGKNMVVWSIVVGLTQMMLQFNTKFGEGSMWNLIWGKYQIPREEQRIFMFVDLNSSTSIAEKLGDEKYHMLLKDFFASITNPILDNKGEIYQYVGDEVVVTWKYAEGIISNRCINCFFDIKNYIATKKGYFTERYGFVPEFKGGMHCGNVIAGEVGIIKRDITFSGDVLNTTSRIQGKCKEYGAELIASGYLLDQLQPAEKYKTAMLGSIQLRGKEKHVDLHGISEL